MIAKHNALLLDLGAETSKIKKLKDEVLFDA